ncbi:MAG: hypothetical protein IKB09_07840 [Oscillospiraceae bacterium]|nr:hypothetical protein [Oscillospiraceae bacterium]
MKTSERKGGELCLKKLIELMLENLSTRDVFLFRIACGACEREFANKPVRFSKSGITPTTQGKKIIYDAVYEQEFQSARQRAIRDAAEQLNYCPICKRLVCNRCFLICDDLDMCKQCAARLEETGSPVFSDVLEAVI